MSGVDIDMDEDEAKNGHLRRIAFLEKRVDYLEKVLMLQEDKIDQLTSELEMERAKLANCTCQEQDQDSSDSDESEPDNDNDNDNSEPEPVVYTISEVEVIKDDETEDQNDDLPNAPTDENVNLDESTNEDENENENPIVHIEEKSSSKSPNFPKSSEIKNDQQSSSSKSNDNEVKNIITEKFQHITNQFKKAKMINREIKNDTIDNHTEPEPNDLKTTTTTVTDVQEPLILYMPEFDEKIIVDDDDDEVEFISEVRPGNKSVQIEDLFSQISYECSFCPLTFTDISDLADHKSTHSHHSSGKRPFKCPTCSETFVQMDHLQIHIRLHHTGGRPYLCSLCPKKFTELLSFKRHQALHSGKLPYECQICKNKYPIREDLEHHTKVANCQAKSLPNFKTNYNKGITREHKCKFCSKAFIHVSLKEIHERIHTGEKPYKCNICSKSFNQGGNLRMHVRLHLDQRPYKCPVCEKSFNQQGNLKSHAKLHN